MAHYVIVGAGQTAVAAVGELAGSDPDASITLIGEEPHLPYQRPPLSKGFLNGDLAVERLHLRPADWYAARGITMRLGERVETLDTERREVHLSAGERIGYDRVLIATGGRPREVPGWAPDAPLHLMRNVADVDQMRDAFVPGRRLLVIGGGYIGLEVAAVARGMGLDVTLVEAAPRILQRVAAPETADYFRDLHTRNGVVIREGVRLAEVLGGESPAATLSDGTKVPFDTAVGGIGILPEIGLAEDAGLAVENGIVVDDHCRTNAPDVFAAGDCASFPFEGRHIRLESVQNAIDHGRCAGRAMAGRGEPYAPLPWFWSDQFDVKLQIAGLNVGYDATLLREEEGRRSVWYLRNGRLAAVDTMNDPRAFMVAKRLLQRGLTPPASQITDPLFDLKQAV